MKNTRTPLLLLLLLLPLAALAGLALLLKNPAFSIQKTEVLPTSATEKREYKGADTKLLVEVKHIPSFIKRPTFLGKSDRGGLDETYLIDDTGEKYRWTPFIMSFSRRGKNLLLTYAVPLNKFPSLKGKATFISKFDWAGEWQVMPISVVVRR